MIRQGHEIYFDHSGPFGPQIAVWLVRFDENGRREFATAIEYQPKCASLPQPPAFSLSEEQGQSLIDRLWQLGFRPTQGRQSEGQNAAISAHLADMRALAFAKLSVPAPECKS